MTRRAIALSLPTVRVRCGLCGTDGRVSAGDGSRVEASIDCACTIPQFELVYVDGSTEVAVIPLRPTRAGKR